MSSTRGDPEWTRCGERSAHFARRNWFSLCLLGVALLPPLDSSGLLASAGQWLGAHGVTALCVFTMFLISGLGLDYRAFRRGASDLPALVLSLGLIFLVAPALALLHALAPLDQDTQVGLLLIAVMPTTLSSGVVMVSLAGGNTATAVVVTLVASILGIFTIPPSLELFLGLGAGSASLVLDKPALALKLGLLVVLPLLAGMGLRRFIGGPAHRSRRLSILSQWLVLTVVWIAVSRSSETLQRAPLVALWGSLLALSFHLALLGTAVLVTRVAGLGPGRREVVWFMGAQKTLPVAILLQTALFPTLGNALVFCVVHHIVHLSVDGALAAHLAPASRPPGMGAGS